MPFYLYTAKNKEGQSLAGRQQAINKAELAAQLRRQGLILISAESAEETKRTHFWLGLSRVLGWLARISIMEKMIFTRHLAVMIRAGLSLNQALQALAQQTTNAKFKKIISQLETAVRRGQSFSQALSQQAQVFDQLYINMVQVGETSGNLDEVLFLLANQMKKSHQLTSRIRGAMIYPAVIVVTMLGIGIAMMIIVVPKLTATFAELEMELPFSTRLLIGTSNFLRNHYLLSILIFLGLISLIRLSLKKPQSKAVIDQALLKLPLFGSLIQKINSARFARIFSSLIEGGVAISQALKITANTLGNTHFKKALIKSIKQVQKGTELSTALAKHKDLYPSMVIQMIQVGEKTGSLSQILKTLAEFYEEEVSQTTKNLSSVIEPVLMIVVGAAVGFFAVSIIQPIYSMMQGL